MLVFYLLLVVVGGVAMYVSIIKTQVVNGEMWRKKAESRERIERTEEARRGTIFSSDDKVLATTVPVCDLCLDLGRWPKMTAAEGKKHPKQYEVYLERDRNFKANLPKVCRILHECFPQRSERYFYDRVMKEYKKSKPGRCLYVARNVPYSRWDAIKKMPGWGGYVVTKTASGKVSRYVRAHIYGNLGENTLGLHFIDDNGNAGYSGLEGYYDDVLRGQDGKYICRRLTMRTWVDMEESEAPSEDSTLVQRKIDGKSIVATIDTRYQDIAESALRSSMNEYGGERGCAILMEVETGYVLACSNLKRDTADNRVKEMLWNNVACSDRYEPGSTFKTVVMTSMLNDKKIALDTSKRVCAGGTKKFGRHCEISDGHGKITDTMNLPGVLAHSSNVGMSELAWQYYRNRREDMKKGIMDIFPFKKLEPDIAVQEPRTGVVKLNSDIDFLNLSYGYSATVTPLQLITFYNALANGGKMVKPLFCREIIDGKRHSKVQPVVLKEHVCSEEIAKQMREMMVGVVEYGTGTIIRGTSYGIGGKTGTTVGIKDKKNKNSSFVGFFPADNPKYTCLVLIEHTSVVGGTSAAPVFKKIADCVVAFDGELSGMHLLDSIRTARPMAVKARQDQLARIYKTLGMPFVVDDSSRSSEWIAFDREKEKYVRYNAPVGIVPNCKGMTVRDAMELLRKMGLKTRFVGQGKVVSQSPEARTLIKKGETVFLKLSHNN